MSEPSEETATSGRNLRSAIIAGLVLAAMAILALVLGAGAFFAFAAIFILLAQGEFFSAVRKAGYDPATALGIIAGVVLLLGSYFRGEAAIPLVLTATIIFTFVWYFVGTTRANVLSSATVTILGVAYAPLLGSFAALMLRRPDGRGVILAALGAAALYDVLAYGGGRKWGKRPLSADISPNKTVEGAIVATAGILLLSTVVAPLLGPWSYPQAFVFGVFICVFAPIGDLVESLLKRDLGIKDMGSIIPGHGGAADRLDAILFAAPATYFSLRLFGL